MDHSARAGPGGDDSPPVTIYLVTRYYSTAHRRFAELLRLRERGWDIRVVYDPAGSRSEPEAGIPVRSFPRFTGVFGKLGLEKLERAIERRLFFPSPAMTYVLNVRRRLGRLIEEDLAAGRRACVVTYLPPLDLLCLGRDLKSRYPGILWVVDGHFPGSADEYYWSRIDVSDQDRARRLEDAAMEECDVVVAESPALKELARTEYRAPEGKIRTIPHSAPDLREVGPRRGPVCRLESDGDWTIGYVGNLFKGEKVPGGRVLEAFNRLNAGAGRRVRLRVVGDRHLRDHPSVASEHPWLEYLERLPHDESFRAVQDCDCLLLVLGDTRWSRVLMSVKLPYYLMLGLPILALVPADSTVADILKTTGSGWVIDERRDWEKAIDEILQGDTDPPDPEDGSGFPLQRLEWGWFVESWEEIFRYVQGIGRQQKSSRKGVRMEVGKE